MANKKEKLVSLWGRLGVQIHMTPEEFEVLQKNDEAARDLLLELIKSNRCSLSGESYFPPQSINMVDELIDELEFDIDFQSLQSDEFEAMEQTLLEQKENPEIWALRGEISNLRHELDSALIYDPEYAPKIEKCLAIRELELNAALEGVKLSLDPDDIIDAEHLDCFWYGGSIGSLKYKGYTVSIEVHGEVRLSVLDEATKTELLYYINKNNSGAYENSEVKDLISDDETLHKLRDEGRAVWSNNNWVEYRIFKPSGEEIDLFGWDTVLDDNVLEAFSDVNYYKDIIDELVLTTEKEVMVAESKTFVFEKHLHLSDMKQGVIGYLRAVDALVDRLPDSEEKGNINFYAEYDVVNGNILLFSSYLTDGADGFAQQKVVSVDLSDSEKKELIASIEDCCKKTCSTSTSCLEFVNEMREKEGLKTINRNNLSSLDDKIHIAEQTQTNATKHNSNNRNDYKR